MDYFSYKKALPEAPQIYILKKQKLPSALS